MTLDAPSLTSVTMHFFSSMSPRLSTNFTKKSSRSSSLSWRKCSVLLRKLLWRSLRADPSGIPWIRHIHCWWSANICIRICCELRRLRFFRIALSPFARQLSSKTSVNRSSFDYSLWNTAAVWLQGFFELWNSLDRPFQKSCPTFKESLESITFRKSRHHLLRCKSTRNEHNHVSGNI